MKNLNCYIHIPFCTSKCKYCRFASFSWINELKIQNYVNFLCQEINNFSYDDKIFLETVYFWWWTPSTLNFLQFEQIFSALKNRFSFSKNIEINIESTPEKITFENISFWEKIWINRLSIGIQSLNEKTLFEISRTKKWNIFECFETLEKYFFKNKKSKMSISLDFIIGLPFVKSGELLENIKYVLEKYTFLKHISIYMLEEYFEVPEEIDSKFDEIIYPNSWKKNSLKQENFLEEYLSIKKYLEKKWIKKYEISNFAKPWFECKHNLWYWNHKENLAFWLWAHGFLDNVRFSNSENFLEYYSWKNIKKEKIWKKEKFLENLMFWLRTSGIDEKNKKFLNEEKLKYFLEFWYLFEKNWKIILNEKYTNFLDYILSEIL